MNSENMRIATTSTRTGQLSTYCIGPRSLLRSGSSTDLEQARLLRSWVWWDQAQVPVRQLGGDSTPGGAGQEPDLDQVRLVHVLDGLGLLRQRRGDGVEADRPSFELQDEGLQEPPVERLEAKLVYL